MRLACPECGGSYSINKRRIKRQRRTSSACVHCGAVLSITKKNGGALKVEVISPATRGVEAVASPTPQPLPVLPEVAVIDEEPELGFGEELRDKTDPDLGPVLLDDSPRAAVRRASGKVPIGAMTTSSPPRKGLSISDDTEIPFADAREDTDPGIGSFGNRQYPGLPDLSPSSGTAVAVLTSGTAVPPIPPAIAEPSGPDDGPPEIPEEPPELPEDVLELLGAPDVSGGEPAAPLSISLPDPSKKPTEELRDVNQMLRDYSVMFRMDTRSKRRRSKLLSIGVVALTAAAVVVVALSSTGTDPEVLDESETLVGNLRIKRANRTAYAPGAVGEAGEKPQQPVFISVVAAKLARDHKPRAEPIAEPIAASAIALPKPSPRVAVPEPPQYDPTPAAEPVKRESRKARKLRRGAARRATKRAKRRARSRATKRAKRRRNRHRSKQKKPQKRQLPSFD